jgi:ppGpp synthetase/RelA/SpoT-type nucleotidyltranferase
METRHLPRMREYYENTAKHLNRQFTESHFWISLRGRLLNLDQRYLVDNDEYLLALGNNSIQDPTTKPWESLLAKTYRKNVHQYPGEYPHGWITPNTWFQRINDILRTTILVRYLDGIDLVCDLVREVAEDHGLELQPVSKEARDYGYYGVHIVVRIPMSMIDPYSALVTRVIPVELQVSTQIKDVFRNLSHKFYEARRSRLNTAAEKWQWDYGCEEFVPNYLGHMLHYCEGMIMQVRMRREAANEVDIPGVPTGD